MLEHKYVFGSVQDDADKLSSVLDRPHYDHGRSMGASVPLCFVATCAVDVASLEATEAKRPTRSRAKWSSGRFWQAREYSPDGAAYRRSGRGAVARHTGAAGYGTVLHVR
jgi:hypothetical protein